MSTKKSVMHVLSHTHWDREWYQDFQGYRQRLVFQMDAMMDLLEERPEYRYFHLDGQTCVLDDYMEVRPGARARLEKHIHSGRILIGPWYVMPDERLLSGESMVRNLLLGNALCRAWGGKPMPIGYVTDVFGHVSQLPQMLRGFGIDTAMLHRGTSCAREKSEMVWEGADGTETLLLAVYQYTGYNDFVTFREWNDDQLRDYEKTKLGLATTDVLFALDGNDHQPAWWDVPEEIERVNNVFAGIRCIHSSMPRFLAALRKALGPRWTRGRKRFVGELTTPAREGQWSHTMCGFGSSRFYLKQANDELEILLPRIAEPLHAWSLVLGGPSQKSFLDRAWRYLLLNHPHDSICGCSIDQVHRDMVYRFDQARLLGLNSAWQSIETIVGGAMPTGGPCQKSVVTLFNPADSDTGSVTRFSIDITADADAPAVLVPVLTDADGVEVPLETICIERRVRTEPFTFITDGVEGISPPPERRPSVPTPAYRIRSKAVDRFHVEAALSVPAFGHASWHVEMRPRSEAPRPAAPLVRVDAKARAIETDLLKLKIAPDGTLDLYDKPTRMRYTGLHVFEDCGDAGEGWNHVCPTRDRRILWPARGAAGRPRVKIVRAGALSAEMRISFSMRVPRDLVDANTGKPFTGREKKTTRTKAMTTLAIETVFMVRAGERRLDCRTVVRNSACCHRLALLFPTRRKTDEWSADSAFDIVRRPIKLIDTTGWLEEARPEHIIKSFAAISDQRGGLAVITKGLNEAAARDDRERTLAVTLFRAFRENLNHEVTRDSQVQGELTFEYAIAPFTPDRGRVPAQFFAQCERFRMPVWSFTRMRNGAAPAADRLIELSPNAVLSTLKVSEDGKALAARLVNSDTTPAQVTLKPGFAFRRVSKADSLEKRTDCVPCRAGVVSLKLRPKEVVTLRFDL